MWRVRETDTLPTMILAAISPVVYVPVLVAAIAVTTALVLRKNPKIAADVNTAAKQVVSAPASVASAAKSAEASVAATVSAVEKKV